MTALVTNALVTSELGTARLRDLDASTRSDVEALPMTTPQDLPSPTALDPVLLEVLACPAEHHAPLALGTPDDPGAPALTCTECGRVFPVRDGIPVLLLEEATGGPAGGVRA